MKIVRKFGLALAAAAVGFGLLGISAPAHASSVHAGQTVHAQPLDITWGV